MKSNVNINKSMFKIHSFPFQTHDQYNHTFQYEICVDYKTKTYFTLRSKHRYNIQCSNYHILNLYFHTSEKKLICSFIL